MPSPFPGMNPYFEHPNIWPGVHHRLIVMLADSLVPQLRPRYRVAIEVRTYETSGERSVLVGLPNVTISRASVSNRPSPNVAIASVPTQPITVEVPIPEILKQGYLEVREVETEAVITAIELLSPTNKRSGNSREAYENKRLKILGSATHLVEIDLLRQLRPMPVFGPALESHYRILVSRSNTRPRADLYAFNLQQAIPLFPIPLQERDTEPIVDLHSLLDSIYDRGGYDMAIDYSRDPEPSLTEIDATWAAQLLQRQELR